MQIQWLQEFNRILKRDGILYLTTHGDQFSHTLSGQDRLTYQKGGLVVRNHNHQGENVCNTFQSPLFFQKKIKSGFEILKHIPGKEKMHLRQDVNVFRKTTDTLELE